MSGIKCKSIPNIKYLIASRSRRFRQLHAPSFLFMKCFFDFLKIKSFEYISLNVLKLSKIQEYVPLLWSQCLSFSLSIHFVLISSVESFSFFCCLLGLPAACLCLAPPVSACRLPLRRRAHPAACGLPAAVSPLPSSRPPCAAPPPHRTAAGCRFPPRPRASPPRRRTPARRSLSVVTPLNFTDLTRWSDWRIGEIRIRVSRSWSHSHLHKKVQWA